MSDFHDARRLVPEEKPLPPVIRGSVTGSFARGVLAERHPALIRQVRDAIPLGPRQDQRLDRLATEIADGVITPLDDEAGDHDVWARWGKEHVGRSWYEVPFLWAESYFYRKLLAATGFFEPGPWRGIDIFAPSKQAEMHGRAVAEELAALDALAEHAAGQRGEVLLRSALWGNQADLGFSASAPAPVPGAGEGRLVADDRTLMWPLLDRAVSIAVFADNVGRELIPDLVLIDHLLQQHAARVVLYVKPYPYYVSDATAQDVLDHLRLLHGADGEAGAIGSRLWQALRTGALDVRSHAFFCAPQPFHDMPDDLRQELADIDVTILKGDLNYRRLVDDRSWDPTTPYAAAVDYFPSPVVALRTLKSDVIVGLTQDHLDELETTSTTWRTSGTHALIQARVPPT